MMEFQNNNDADQHRLMQRLLFKYGKHRFSHNVVKIIVFFFVCFLFDMVTSPFIEENYGRGKHYFSDFCSKI